MNDQSIEELKKAVETVLSRPNVTFTPAQSFDAQHAYAQLMQELENATASNGYSSGYRAGWNDALHTVQNHCVDEHKP
jgi:cellobiose phosphorylase